jgi:hypothetical protein
MKILALDFRINNAVTDDNLALAAQGTGHVQRGLLL